MDANVWYFPQMPSILHAEVGSHPEPRVSAGLATQFAPGTPVSSCLGLQMNHSR